jgi:hypothetical protein
MPIMPAIQRPLRCRRPALSVAHAVSCGESRMTSSLAGWVVDAIELMAALFLFAVGSFVLATVAMFFLDRNQTRNSVLRNYPVIGHFRYWFQHLGEFFRQYFFASDREELPFNRAERVWVYRAAKNVDNTQAFGSTRDLHA